MSKKNFLLLSLFFISTTILAEYTPGIGGGVPATDAIINFGSQNSAFKISSGATFNVSSASQTFTVDGTLQKDSNASISGNPIQFTDGVLLTDGAKVEMTSVFDPASSDYIWLTGDSYFDSEPGKVIEKLYVSGIRNRLEGQPIFNQAIEFYDGSVTLTVALQNKLTQNITLNGGAVGLDDDLRLADGVKILGPGTVSLQNCQLMLGSYYPTPWSEKLIWDSSTDVVMTGSVSLTEDWYFTGTCKLNGNGNILDLSGGGRLYIESNSALYLADVYIKGVGSIGGIVFKNGNGLLNTTNVDIELTSDYTTSLGKLLVEGPTSFVLRDKDWTFNGDSTLQVDGTTLWLDVPEDNPGELKAPEAIFEDHVWNPGNVTTDLASNLDFVNSGTVRELVDRQQAGGSTSSSLLTSATLTVSLSLDESVHIHPNQRINIGNRITIDGQGAELVFSSPEHSQFVVRPGQTVTLKNIQLDRINQKTFNLMFNPSSGPTSLVEGKIFIGENVVFGLSENVTFSQGLITLLNDSQTNEPVVFRVVGVDGKHKLVFNPTQDYINSIYRFTGGEVPTHNLDRINQKDGVPFTNSIPDFNAYAPILLKLGENTMRLEAINLVGLQHISQILGFIYAGAIGLGGSATVDVGDTSHFLKDQPTGPSSIKESYSTVFVVADLENRIRLLKNNLEFTGQLTFAGTGDNVVHVDAVLSDQVAYNEQGNQVAATYPTVFFQSNFLDLTSRDAFDAKKSGIARLIFDDQIIRVYNFPNAFWVHENSFLGGNRIEIEGDSIYDDYDPNSQAKPFVIDVQDLVGVNGIDPWVSLFTRSSFLDELNKYPLELKSFNRKYKTALDLEIEKEREREIAAQRPSVEPRPRPRPIPSKPRLARKNLIELLGTDNVADVDSLLVEELKKNDGFEDVDLNTVKSILTRTIQPAPAGEKVDYHYNLRNLESPDLTGNHIVDNSTLTKLGISSTQDVNITLNPNGVLKLLADSVVTLKTDDVINVVGKGNEIYVFNTFYVNGNLLFDTDSQLKIVLATDDAKIVFAQNSRIDLESNTELTIEGNGTVEFGSNSIINLKGNRNTVALWPSLILKDRAQMNPTLREYAKIQGVGNVIIKDSAKMVAEGTTGIMLGNTSWIIGNANTDMIDLYVLGTGAIELSGSAGHLGVLSMQEGDHSLTVYQGGILRIEDNGLFEINSVGSHGTRAPGNFKRIIFGTGSNFYLYGGGAFSLSDNRFELPEYGGQKIYWDSRMCNILGDGLIRYVGRDSSKTFAGKIQTSNAQFKSSTFNGTPTIDIVSTLVNQNSNLITAIEYTDVNEIQQLRLTNATTKAVSTIAVTSGDTLTGEDSTGNVTGYTIDGRNVTYNTDGTRVVG